MGDSLGYLFAAVLVTWAVIAIYLLVIASRVSSLRRDVEALKRDASTEDVGEPPPITL